MIDHLNYLQDTLSGYNVKADYYIDHDAIARHEIQKRLDLMQVLVPFAIQLYDDGMDVDGDGNLYFDDYPGYFMHGFYANRQSMEAAYSRLAEYIPEWQIEVIENYWADAEELEYNAIKE